MSTSPNTLNAFHIKWHLSTATIGTAISCGGAIAGETSSYTMHGIFDKVTDEEADTGKTEFRCLFVKNTHPTDPIRNPILIIPQNTSSTHDVMLVGWAPQPFNAAAETIATESTFPARVTFKEAATRTEGAVLGRNIPPGSWRAFWLMRKVTFEAQGFPLNACVLRLLADNIVDEVIDQAPEPVTDLSFTVGGEHDLNSIFKDIVDRIKQRNVNLHVSVGNHTTVQASAGKAFAMAGGGKAMARAGNITAMSQSAVIGHMQMAFGADDIRTASQENEYKNTFGYSKRYHAFQLQNIHFLFMDTASGKKNWDAASAQYEFVKKDLIAANADPATDFIFVVSNKVMYATGGTTASKFILKDLRELYVPLFQDAGVHVVIQGYINNYQRSLPIHWDQTDTNTDDIPDQNSDNPTIILSGQDPDYTIAQGFEALQDTADPPKRGCIYIVAGMGGRGHDDVSSPANTYTIKTNISDYGYLYGRLFNTPEERKITMGFYSTKEKREDTFTITKILSGS